MYLKILVTIGIFKANIAKNHHNANFYGNNKDWEKDSSIWLDGIQKVIGI